MPKSLLTASQLIRAGASRANAALYAAPLAASCARRDVTNAGDLANLLSQIMNESGNLTCVRELMSYSTAARIHAVFPSHFHNVAAARPYVRRPKKLGDLVYAKLGGYERRGAGLAQVTGTDNFTRYAEDLGISLTKVAAQMTTPGGAADSAVWFFVQAGCLGVADPRDVRCRWAGLPEGSTPIGLANVLRLHELFARILGVSPSPSAVV